MTLQQQRTRTFYRFRSRKDNIKYYTYTRARLCSEYEFLYKISSHLHLVNSLVSLLASFNLHYN